MAAANRRGCGNRRGCAAVAVAPVSAMVLMERRGAMATTALPCIIWRNRDRRVQGLHQRGVSNQRVRACARTVGECARASVCMARARSRGLKLGRGGGGGAHMRGLVLHLSTWRQSGHVLRPQCCERERERVAEESLSRHGRAARCTRIECRRLPSAGSWRAHAQMQTQAHCRVWIGRARAPTP